ncbi:DUF6588 family protein [Calditrichota bacterium]
MKHFFTVLLIVGLLLITAPLAAQSSDKSLSETLSSLSQDAAVSYLSPIASAFGANLNAGWFHSAPEATKFSFDLEIGVVAMGSFFPDDAQTFETSGSFKFSQTEAKDLLAGANIPAGNPVYNQVLTELTTNPSNVQISGATIVGLSTDSIRIKISTNNAALPVELQGKEVVLPIAGFGDLSDVNVLPLGAPQFSFGTVYGTQATFRWLPTVKINDDLGDFSYFGFGLQHNPGIWFKNPLPFDVAASFFTQSLSVGELFETSTTAFGVNASYTIGPSALSVTPYAGFMFESSTMSVTYDFIIEDALGNANIEKIKFDLEGENKTRLTLGLSFRLLLININADYNFGTYNSFSAGLTFRI